ncbi:sulfur transfer complex subunit TusB [Gallibacterium anatis]|uniref:DsrH/TusB family sulfur relay protein n=1 Tax=Gallibacterium anatis TaxID=750 RepID=UPI0005321E4B|nr:DsrH/TusB family sulfur metabolism protein [Gallibacterium anatis]KGQ28916.1 sulfur transfer complex subunit TusB [Gallibacterium anatis]
MLYTFANRQYDIQWLQQIFQQLTPCDVILLWQDGVLLPLKYPILFNQLTQYFLLENDVMARGISSVLSKIATNAKCINLSQTVQITEDYYPQINL